MNKINSINKHNYFEQSFGQFHLVNEGINREPDYISYCKKDPKKVSSRYWYTQMGVYRESDHWGRVGKCAWFLNEKNVSKIKNHKVLAFCSWKSMKEIQIFDCLAGKLLTFMNKSDLNRLVIKSSFKDLYFSESYGTITIVNELGENTNVYSYSTIKIVILDKNTNK